MMAIRLSFCAQKFASIRPVYLNQTSGGRKETLPPKELAPLASIFRHRLLTGIGSASLVAIGANFGGITSFLLGFSPETGRNLKLDVLYPIGGYSRCLETSEGFGTSSLDFLCLYFTNTVK